MLEIFKIILYIPDDWLNVSNINEEDSAEFDLSRVDFSKKNINSKIVVLKNIMFKF